MNLNEWLYSSSTIVYRWIFSTDHPIFSHYRFCGPDPRASDLTHSVAARERVLQLFTGLALLSEPPKLPHHSGSAGRWGGDEAVTQPGTLAAPCLGQDQQQASPNVQADLFQTQWVDVNSPVTNNPSPLAETSWSKRTHFCSSVFRYLWIGDLWWGLWSR